MHPYPEPFIDLHAQWKGWRHALEVMNQLYKAVGLFVCLSVSSTACEKSRKVCFACFSLDKSRHGNICIALPVR